MNEYTEVGDILVPMNKPKVTKFTCSVCDSKLKLTEEEKYYCENCCRKFDSFQSIYLSESSPSEGTKPLSESIHEILSDAFAINAHVAHTFKISLTLLRHATHPVEFTIITTVETASPESNFVTPIIDITTITSVLSHTFTILTSILAVQRIYNSTSIIFTFIINYISSLTTIQI